MPFVIFVPLAIVASLVAGLPGFLVLLGLSWLIGLWRLGLWESDTIKLGNAPAKRYCEAKLKWD